MSKNNSSANRKGILQAGIVYLAVMLIVITAPFLRSLAASFTVEMLIKFSLYLIMAGMVFLCSRLFHDPIHVFGYQKGNPGRQMLLALPVFVIVILTLIGLPLLLGMEPSYLLPSKLTEPYQLVLTIIHQMLFVGIVEELVFRGYLPGKLTLSGVSPVWAAIISAILFGFMHFPVGQDFLQLFLTALLGCIWGFARIKIKDCSTLTTGIAHGLHNSTLLLLRYFLF